MKIGIITICKVNNYGAELQAFATQRKLQLMGYDAEIIDYLYYKNWRFKDSKMSMPFIPLTAKERLAYWIKYRVIDWFVDTVLPLLNKDARRRSSRYQQFWDNVRFSRQYTSMPQLYSAALDYDVYFVGSDQVWNPSASSSIEPYFLTFASVDAKRCSYASSFGVSSIPTELDGRYSCYLKDFDSISVRESEGVELVKRLSGRDAALVVDPTLLLRKSEWKPYMRPVKALASQYVLIYELLPSPELMRIARAIGRERKMPVYNITKRAFATRKCDGVENIKDAGPAEFLWLIAHAACVVTNSFHGTALSVNFGVPFCCVLNRSRNNNSRITSLLRQIGLDSHIIYEDNIGQYDERLIFEPFDTNAVLPFVEGSEKYIKECLKP